MYCLNIKMAWLACTLSASVSYSLDHGVPWSAMEDLHPSIIEVYGERFKRDIKQEVAFSKRTFTGHQIEDRLLLRWYRRIHASWWAHLEVGASDVEHAVDPAPVFGAGFQTRLASLRELELCAFASGSYIGDIAYRHTYDEPHTYIESERDEHYLEVSGGLTASAGLRLSQHWHIRSYAGLACSLLRGWGEERFVPRSAPTQLECDNSVNLDQDIPLSVIAGAGFMLHERFGLRLEGRFVDHESYSLAGFVLF